MKSSVITFPGSNCDRDMDVALKKFGFKNEENYQKLLNIYQGNPQYLQIIIIFSLYFFFVFVFSSFVSLESLLVHSESNYSPVILQIFCQGLLLTLHSVNFQFLEEIYSTTVWGSFFFSFSFAFSLC